MVEMVQRTLTTHVFTEMSQRSEGPAIKWLVATLLGSPRFQRYPIVIVVTDEDGIEIGRSSWGAISPALRQLVDKKFPV